MKKLNLIKTIGIVLAISISNISAANTYDGRGDKNCSELKQAIDDAKQELRRNRSYLRDKQKTCNIQKKRARALDEEIRNPNTSYKRAKELSALAILQAFTNSGCFEADRAKNEMEEAQYNKTDAVDNYNMNGCTSGGKTNYQHNY